MKKLLILPLIALVLMAGSCESDATKASRNLSTAADNFEIVRNIVFYNTWTDTEVVTVTGLCSLDVGTSKLSVTCKEPDGLFKKHYLGRSANLSFFAVQLESVNVSTFHTRIVWKPQGFIPDFDLKFDGEELLNNQNTNG